MTPSRMPTAGSTEKDADEVTTRFSTAGSIPIATPAFQARTANTTQMSATKATMPPQIRYMTGEDSSLITDTVHRLHFFPGLTGPSVEIQYTTVSRHPEVIPEPYC